MGWFNHHLDCSYSTTQWAASWRPHATFAWRRWRTECVLSFLEGFLPRECWAPNKMAQHNQAFEITINYTQNDSLDKGMSVKISQFFGILNFRDVPLSCHSTSDYLARSFFSILFSIIPSGVNEYLLKMHNTHGGGGQEGAPSQSTTCYGRLHKNR